MQEIIDLDEGDIALYLCCADELLFMLLFWGEDLSEEMSIEQKLMACDRSKRVLACTGRKIAKTLVIESKVVRLSMMHIQRGGGITEAMMFTPRDSHLTPIVDRVYGRIHRTPFLKEFFTEMRRGEAPKLSCKTGLVWYARIEGVSGTDQNMVGLRARYILGDELAFGNCLASGTIIPLDDGTPKKIEDVEKGDHVWSWGDSGYWPSLVVGKKCNGKKKVLRISTGTKTVFATENHPFLCVERTKIGQRGDPKKSKSEWSLVWKNAGDLSPKDFVVASNGVPDVFGSESELTVELPDGLVVDRIRDVQYAGIVDTWDIETEAHNFIANGFLVHNSVCHQSRIQTALPGCEWWYSGVPNGVRSSPFYLLDQTAMGREWSRHKYPTFVNPIYQGDEAKESLIESYNGEHTQGYKTQVLGEWGDETVSSFPPGAIAVGNHPYYTKTLTSAMKNTDSAVAVALGLPSVRADKFCIGWDYGYSPDPSVLLIAYTRGGNKWACYARITMRQVVLPVQCRVVRYLYSTMLLGGFGGLCCDSADAIQTLQGNDPAKADRFYRTAPGGTMGMIDELGQPVMEKNEKTGKDEQVMIRVKQYLTERFRQFMINTNLELPGIQLTLGNDTELIEELAGTTESKTQGGYTVYYGPPDPESSGKMLDHGADASRMLSDAIMKAIDRPEESDEEFLLSMGWAKGSGEAWSPAWENATP